MKCNVRVQLNKHKYNIGIILLIITSMLLGWLVFSGAYVDLWRACQNAWQYVLDLFTLLSGGEIVPPLPPPVVPPDGGGEVVPPLPPIIAVNPDIMIARLKMWGMMLISGHSYAIFGTTLANILLRTISSMMLFVPVLVILYFIIIKMYFKVNNKHGENTKMLCMWWKVSTVSIVPVCTYIRELTAVIKASKFKYLLYMIWCFNFNLPGIIISTIPFYLYFAISGDLLALYKQLVFIIASLKYVALLTPFVLVPIAFVVIDKMRIKLGKARLESFEAYNEAQLENREISTTKDGAMGTCKTKTLTDEALTLSVMDTKKAEADKSVCRKMFPMFSWIQFELEIEKCVVDKKILNWATACVYVDNLEQDHAKGVFNLYGYDEGKYGLEYYNGIAVQPLFKVLKDYARLHILYVSTRNSFIISNYPIREDKVIYTEGNTFKWDYSFYNFNKDYQSSSYISKILNFDILRMCKTLKEWKGNSSLEYGVICMAEADKEQMNAVETLADSVNSPYPNPKNDGITKTEKFIRHRATIMGHCYVHILKDTQRAMSMNADTREISNLEHMQRPKGEKNALPLFWEGVVYGIWSKGYNRFDDAIRYYRGDNTLLHYALKRIDKALYDLYYIRKNRYGYAVINREIESGKQDGCFEVTKHYLCYAKIHADRYNTATHEKHFYEKNKDSGTGVMSYESYGSTTMTDREFDSQNSYSRENMVNPDWKKPYVEKDEAEKLKAKELAKLEAKQFAEEEKAKAKAIKEEEKKKEKETKENEGEKKEKK